MGKSESVELGPSPSINAPARDRLPWLVRVSLLVIALGSCLNLMNLGFLTHHDVYSTNHHDDLIALVRGGEPPVPTNDDWKEPDDDRVIETNQSMVVAPKESAEESEHQDEIKAFRRIIARAVSSLEACNSLTRQQGEPQDSYRWQKVVTTGVDMLPEFGVINALEDWISKVEGTAPSTGVGTYSEEAYPTCHLPPPTSCGAKSYSLILMSHTTERLGKMMGGITDIAGRKATEEIILVWNSPRSLLESDNLGKKLLMWDGDDSHKLRIFFSLENDLPNSLLNRYHPSIGPKSEALMYFDDDGPFFSERAMSDVGFELWKRNSDVQVGSFGRNLRVESTRMKDAQSSAHKQSLDSILREGSSKSENDNTVETDADAPFTPTCRERTGDIIEYNFFVFPNFGAHMFLPSGSFLHRNYLCFIWHPALKELRDFIRDHPTHPDDQTVSAIVSHLIGKAPRSFPRRAHAPKEIMEAKEDSPNIRGASGEGAQLTADDDSVVVDGDEQHMHHVHANKQHRRLLWEKQHWGPMREEAANSVVGYFGSVNPGSVGWCAGTDYQKPAPRSPGGYICEPEFPSLDQVPWINSGALGSDICT